MKGLIILLFVLFLAACSSSPQYKTLDKRPLISSWTDGTDKGVPRAKYFAQALTPYAVLSYEVYDKDENFYEKIPYPTNESWQEILIDQGIEDDISFAARAWLRVYGDKKEVIVAFRGTDEGLEDFFRGNFVFFKPFIYRTHFDAAEDFIEKVKSYMHGKDELDLILTGHSLGGGLAEYIHLQNEGSKAITFDSSPNTGRLYSLFDIKHDRKVIRAYEKGEILEWPRKLFLWDFSFDAKPWEDNISTIYYQFYDSNLISAHGMQDLAMSIIKAAALNNDPTALSILNQLP
jgi:hypothetical protein